MRNVTIQREKTIVACLSTIKVYLEDPAANELTVCGTPCRLLGTLKNGERKTFSVEEDERRLFVIADRISKDYANESYLLPAGGQDPFLTGKNCFEPSRGNAFRFAGNNTPQVAQARRRGKKTGLIVLIVAFLVGVAGGSLLMRGVFDREVPKTFTDRGFSITLTSAFRPTEQEPFYLCYDSEKVAVFVLREAFSDYGELEAYSPEDYARFTISANGLDAPLLRTASGILYFEYEEENEEEQCFYHRAYSYRSDDAFWLVQYACRVSDAESLLPRFDAWADTVAFP